MAHDRTCDSDSDNTADLTLEGTPGDDVLQGQAGNDTIYGRAGNDTLRGGPGNDFIIGEAGDDWIMGQSGNDLLDGYEGDDRIEGGDGDDSLGGGPGSDVLIGGNGNDSYVFYEGDRIIERKNGGIDHVTVYTPRDYTLGKNLENLTLKGNDTAVGRGNALDNLIINDNPNEARLYGRAGNDTLIGYTEADRLDGGTGDDVLDGREGRDRLIGGLGRDTLTGGADGDTFVFRTANEIGLEKDDRDVITDFVSGLDRLDLSRLDADLSSKKNDDFDTLLTSGADFTEAGQLKFEDRVLYGNQDADSEAEFAIELSGVTGLDMADIIA
ncbi:calcium-binding protein [Azotobacter salinestris]|uniref:calcium-binding protein n=1 Tax=Azotobacter salinestris TaxID=69964 RepID=UPI0012669746|nr:calcium-binding protein [Azotobacter salinestris]